MIWRIHIAGTSGLKGLTFLNLGKEFPKHVYFDKYLFSYLIFATFKEENVK